jgi:hypothetical protein
MDIVERMAIRKQLDEAREGDEMDMADWASVCGRPLLDALDDAENLKDQFKARAEQAEKSEGNHRTLMMAMNRLIGAASKAVGEKDGMANLHVELKVYRDTLVELDRTGKIHFGEKR